MKSSASHRHFSATTGMDDEVERRQLYHQFVQLDKRGSKTGIREFKENTHLPRIGDRQVLADFVGRFMPKSLRVASTRPISALVKRRTRPPARLILVPPSSGHAEIAAAPAAVGLHVAFGTCRFQLGCILGAGDGLACLGQFRFFYLDLTVILKVAVRNIENLWRLAFLRDCCQKSHG